MATFKEITAADVKTSKSSLNQLIDIIQEDVSGSNTRRKYQVFVTGGVGPGVTSSLFQTVYDQSFNLQTSNAIFDMTVGLYESGSTVVSASTGIDSSGKLLFPSTSIMMREKVDVYRQFSQTLLGNSQNYFSAPYGSASTSDQITEGMFLCFKRLFARDKLKRETFAMRFYTSASRHDIFKQPLTNFPGWGPNLHATSISGSSIFTDIGSATNKLMSFGGEVGNIVDSSATNNSVGLMFYDAGIAVFDLNKVMSGSQHASGTIDAMRAGSTRIGDVLYAGGKQPMGGAQWTGGAGTVGKYLDWTKHHTGNPRAKFIPDFMVSASMDNIVDHLATTRFSSGTLTSMTFQNVTNINSTLIFCRATADEFNYSANPTYTNSENRIRVIDPGQEDTQRSFTFPTTVGLYDSNDNLLAVAKMSRPIEKNDEKDLTVRIRLDF
jgi:hypothetical protein